MNRFRRLAVAAPAIAMPFVPMQCASVDTVDNTTYVRVGSQGIAATPDLQFFKDAGAPLIHLYVLCNIGGALRYVHGQEWSVYDMRQGQTLNVYCENVGGTLSTDWHVVGRVS